MMTQTLAREIIVVNPYDGTTVATVPAADATQVDAAVTAAEKAFQTTVKALTAQDRSTILRDAARLLRERADKVAKLVVSEVGKPIRDARREIGRACELFDLAANHALELYGEVVPMDAMSGGEHRFGFVLRVPLGVIAAITPFNSPVNLSVNKIAPALAAGNTVVHKPASKTPLSAFELAECLAQAGLPRGAYEVVVGNGSEVGDALVRDERVRMVTFTGGVPVGLRIHAAAGIKKVTLELGGNSANIVCADADVPAAARSLATSAFLSSGQACISAQRLIVHSSVLEAFLKEIVPLIEAMKIGDPLDESTEIGPMVSEADIARMLEWIVEAKSMGARALTGGRRVGNSVAPTLLIDVPQHARAFCEEAFGPIATVSTFNTHEEALAIANASKFGLQGAVYTRDINTMMYFARELQVGALWVNESSRYRQDNYPFGGVKQSGLGKEGVRYAIEDMTDLKFVGIKLGVTRGIL